MLAVPLKAFNEKHAQVSFEIQALVIYYFPRSTRSKFIRVVDLEKLHLM